MMLVIYDFSPMLEPCLPLVFQRDMGPVDGRAVVLQNRTVLFFIHSVFMLRMPAAWGLMQGISSMIGVLHRRIMADIFPSQVNVHLLQARPRWIRLGVLLLESAALLNFNIILDMSWGLDWSPKDVCGMYCLVVLFRT